VPSACQAVTLNQPPWMQIDSANHPPRGSEYLIDAFTVYGHRSPGQNCLCRNHIPFHI